MTTAVAHASCNNALLSIWKWSDLRISMEETFREEEEENRGLFAKLGEEGNLLVRLVPPPPHGDGEVPRRVEVERWGGGCAKDKRADVAICFASTAAL